MTENHNSIFGKNILLVISGGIAAYKSLDLIRRLDEYEAQTKVIMTHAATKFLTPLPVTALCHGKVFTDLFHEQNEANHNGHIKLARESDLIAVVPASADLMAKMVGGMADDLATIVLLAARCPILLAPAMNSLMWDNPFTKRNIKDLKKAGMYFIGPECGKMAEIGEHGYGRLAATTDIIHKINHLLGSEDKQLPLVGMKVLVTAGPTREFIDPVRYISNCSSGKQGYAIAAALAKAGAQAILVSGPVNLPVPPCVEYIPVENAAQMYQAVEQSLPVDIAVMTSAVADWKVASPAREKIKKSSEATMSLHLTKTPDIIKMVSQHKKRPRLLIGFAAETENIINNATAKLKQKQADWIVANDVSPAKGVIGGEHNTVTLLTKSEAEEWPTMRKHQVAQRLVERIITYFNHEKIVL